MSAEGAAPDGDRAIPPRYWWLKRILLGVLALFILLHVLRLWWGHVAESRFEAEVARYRAAGQPVDPEDFDPPPIDDEDNAALLYMEAANAIVTPQNVDLDILGRSFSPEYVRANLEDMHVWVESNAEPLKLLQRARERAGVDWEVQVQSPIIGTYLPMLSPQRELVKLVGSVALYEHAAGDHNAAVGRVLDMLRVASAIDRQPSLISHLVSIALRDMVIRTVEAILPNLVIENKLEAHSALVPSDTRAQLESVIAALQDETNMTAAARTVCFFERAMMIDTVDLATTGRLGPIGLFSTMGGGAPAPASLPERAAVYPLGPLIMLDALKMCQHLTTWAEAVSKPTWPVAAEAAPRDPSLSKGIESLQHPLSRMLLPFMRRPAVLHFRAVADQRMAIIAIALRLYRHDHGALPELLKALVPDYLDELPGDPFAVSEREFGYLPDNERPILYSVGENGIDEGGAVDMNDRNSVDYYMIDQVFFLDGARPSKAEDLPTEMLWSEEGDGDQ